jgi:cell wall-associated NlpC family hydrolase
MTSPPLLAWVSARAEVMRVAATWLRTPYHHMARVKGAGVDCAQLLIGVYAEAGLIDEFDPPPYPADWHLHHGEERYLQILEQFADPVHAPEPADVAVWQFGRTYSHAAIVLEWPLVVHALMADGQVSMGEGDRGEMLWLRDGVRRPVRFYSLFARRERVAAERRASAQVAP